MLSTSSDELLGWEHFVAGLAALPAGSTLPAPAPALVPTGPCVAAFSTPSPQVLSLAVRHRRVGTHEMNMESSRSHSIFTGKPGGKGAFAHDAQGVVLYSHAARLRERGAVADP